MADAVEQPTVPEEAIEAATDAVASRFTVLNADRRSVARIALAAAVPVIEKQLRARLADEIEAHAPADRGDSERAPDYRGGVRSGYLDAADIVRRTAEVAIGWPLGRDAARIVRGEQP